MGNDLVKLGAIFGALYLGSKVLGGSGGLSPLQGFGGGGLVSAFGDQAAQDNDPTTDEDIGVPPQTTSPLDVLVPAAPISNPESLADVVQTTYGQPFSSGIYNSVFKATQNRDGTPARGTFSISKEGGLTGSDLEAAARGAAASTRGSKRGAVVKPGRLDLTTGTFSGSTVVI